MAADYNGFAFEIGRLLDDDFFESDFLLLNVTNSGTSQNHILPPTRSTSSSPSTASIFGHSRGGGGSAYGSGGGAGPVYPHNPDVNLRKLPFSKVQSTLMRPTALQPQGTGRFQEQKFNFYLSPSQASEIAESCFRDANGRPDYKKQIQMRFSLSETSCEQEDNFPSSICVKVNNKLQPLPNPIPTNKPGMEPKRPPKPINVTSLCKLSSTIANYVDVSWAVEIGRGYTVSIYYVDKLSTRELMKELRDRGTRHADYTRALIKEKLNDSDNDVMTTSCKVTLACPLGKMRMTYPCRASTCDHLQCFDANLFLMMNEKKPKWLCPVCNKLALFDNLLIDGYFKEVIADTKLPTDDHEIVLHNDGTWEAMPSPKQQEEDKQKEREQQIKREKDRVAKKASKVPETLNVDDDDDDDEMTAVDMSMKSSSNGTASSSAAQMTRDLTPATDADARAAEKRAIECVTLDSDSDEDDSTALPILPPPSKRIKTNFDDHSDSESPPPASTGAGSKGSEASGKKQPRKHSHLRQKFINAF